MCLISKNSIVVYERAYQFLITLKLIKFPFFADENKDINGHPEDDFKRQRSHYNGDQLYSNVS